MGCWHLRVFMEVVELEWTLIRTCCNCCRVVLGPAVQSRRKILRTFDVGNGLTCRRHASFLTITACGTFLNSESSQSGSRSAGPVCSFHGRKDTVCHTLIAVQLLPRTKIEDKPTPSRMLISIDHFSQGTNQSTDGTVALVLPLAVWSPFLYSFQLT